VSGPQTPPLPKEVEVTQEMIEAAEKVLWDSASKFNVVTLDEIHRDTIRMMIEAALSKLRATHSI
jgi:hypothetical protein